MQIVGVRVEDTKNRVKWKTVIRCGDPWKREKPISYNIIIIISKICHLLDTEKWCWTPELTSDTNKQTGPISEISMKIFRVCFLDLDLVRIV